MTSTHYRFYAEEIRARSAEYTCQDTRLAMQKVAEMWDSMAAEKERWEAIEAKHEAYFRVENRDPGVAGRRAER